MEIKTEAGTYTYVQVQRKRGTTSEFKIIYQIFRNGEPTCHLFSAAAESEADYKFALCVTNLK